VNNKLSSVALDGQIISGVTPVPQDFVSSIIALNGAVCVNVGEKVQMTDFQPQIEFMDFTMSNQLLFNKSFAKLLLDKW
jgi:hypothetical protein